MFPSLYPFRFIHPVSNSIQFARMKVENKQERLQINDLVQAATVVHLLPILSVTVVASNTHF